MIFLKHPSLLRLSLYVKTQMKSTFRYFHFFMHTSLVDFLVTTDRIHYYSHAVLPTTTGYSTITTTTAVVIFLNNFPGEKNVSFT